MGRLEVEKGDGVVYMISSDKRMIEWGIGEGGIRVMVEMKSGEEVRSLLLVERGVGWGMVTWWRGEKGRRRGLRL